MKQCPKCGLTLTDDNFYCLEDGTALFPVSTAAGYQSQDVPTQVIDRSSLNRSVSNTAGRPVFLYVTIAVLCTALASAAVFIFVLPRNDSSEKAVQNSFVNSEKEHPATTPQIAVATPRPANTPDALSSVDIAQAKADITERITLWKAASEAKDLDRHMSMYAESVEYYKNRSASRNFIRNDKQRAYSKFDSIRIDIDIVEISLAVSGDSATAIIDKEWLFEGGGYLAGKVRQQLKFKRIGGEWLISGERDQKVYYTRTHRD